MKFRAAILQAIFLISALSFLAGATRLLKQDSKKSHLELELVVEVSRHGERASKKIFDLADGENFQVNSKELTKTGAESHHKLGHSLREEFDALNFIDTT